MKKRYVKGLLSSIYCIFVFHSQAHSPLDSVQKLPNIDIISQKNNLKNLYNKEDCFIATSLQNQSSQFYIKNYGLGQVSTISYQGQSAENTAILWENLPINSIMSGVYDLNLLSNNVPIRFNHSSNLFGSGGVIQFDNSKHETTPFEAQLQLLSIHLISQSFNLYKRIGKSKLYFNNQFIFGTNQFNYIDKFNDSKTMQHNSITQINSQLTHKYQLSKGVLNSGIWINYSDKEIPPTMTTQVSEQKLRDINLRIYTGYETKSFESKISFHSENQSFTDDLFQIKSSNKSLSFINYWQLKSIEFLKTKLNFIQYLNYYQIYSNNYQNHISHIAITNSFNINKEVSEKYTFNTGLKQQVTSRQVTLPLPYFSFQWKPDSRIKNTFYIDMNQRLPTANEMYWSPGGNLDIKPESIFQVKNTINVSHITYTQAFLMTVEPFYSSISNGIKWIPSVNPSIWTPINIQKTTNYGALVELEWNKAWSKHFKTRCITSNQWISSTINETKENIYTPKYKNTNHISLIYKKWELSMTNNNTSYRYTDIENTNFLNAYHLFNSEISYLFSMKKGSLKALLGINNIGNISYQEIDNRALPMRYYHITIHFKSK